MDVDGEDDAADDVQQVVDGQVLRDGIVDGRGPGGGRIEPGGGFRSGWRWRWRPVEWSTWTICGADYQTIAITC